MSPRQSFSVSVTSSTRPNGTRFVVSIEPVPIMKWHDVPNARQGIREIIAKTAGTHDRKTSIVQGTIALLRMLSKQAKLYPQNYNDNDEYIKLLSTEQPPE